MSEHPIDPAMPLDRLDMMLVASDLVESRSKAQRLIKAGHVRVDGETITKPSFMVKAGHCELAVDKGDDYVSRGAYKLLGAFKAFADDGLTGPQSLECLDIHRWIYRCATARGSGQSRGSRCGAWAA